MEPMLADDQVGLYDIIALQEPWKNTLENRTYCPRASNFVPAYDDCKRRSCFLVNKNLDTTTWHAEFLGPDLAILNLRLKGTSIWIYNTYSQPPGGYGVTEYPTPIPRLAPLLEREGEHILLGDFNLHHPMWSGVRNPTIHIAAEPLAQLVALHNLSLALPRGEITWEARGFSSTIDLVFLSPGLQERLISCSVRRDLDFGSDHYPISTELELESTRIEQIPRRCWKRTDLSIVQAGAMHLSPPPNDLSEPQDIDDYAEYLIRFCQVLIDQAVPWSKPSRRGQPWWTQEVKDLVQQEREARRQHDWEGQRIASRKKNQMIGQAKRKQFREAIEEATQGEGIWKLAKWGRTNYGPVVLPNMPPLRTEDSIAYTIEEKAEVLRKRFYPKVEADLDDITDTTFSDETFLNPIEVESQATAEEIASILQTRRANRAPGDDSISNDFLKAMGTPLTVAVAGLTTACWKTGHYPARFRHARTVVIRKPNKPSYETAGAWRPIALLNTIGKLIEAITAQRIKTVVEEQGLLPDTQMGARATRSTDTALELLTEQVRTVWKSPKYVATLLSLDLSGAFDTVHHIRLLDILRKKGIPGWLVRWIRAFLSNRTTTLIIQGKETDPFSIEYGVPQGSTLSPILFLLYASQLLEICNRPKDRISAIGFADDSHILTYSKSTETNCRTLERIHNECLVWARRHGMSFAPQKYELTHFTRSRTKFNLQASASFNGIHKEPSKEVKVLGVWLDSKLRWTSHARELTRKADRQIGALARITASTWGAAFVRARQVYSSVVRPLLAYRAATWYTPTSGSTRKLKGLANKLQRIQNKCLRTMTGAYRATPIASLETETFVPPIDLYLDSRAAAFQTRFQNAPVSQVVSKARKEIERRIKLRGKASRTRTQGQQREEWKDRRAISLGSEQIESRKVLIAWEQRWKSRPRTEWDQIQQPPDKKILRLHNKLKKAESSVIVQLRTGRIGLAHFLNKARVPEYDSGQCQCGQGEETPRHLLLYCPVERERREALGTRQERSFTRLLTTPEGAARAARWTIQGGRLRQFQVAGTLLYE